MRIVTQPWPWPQGHERRDTALEAVSEEHTYPTYEHTCIHTDIRTQNPGSSVMGVNIATGLKYLIDLRGFAGWH